MPVAVDTVDPRIARVTLSNPARRNALDRDMLESLARLWPQLAEDGAIGAVILSGEGGAFCAGADLASDLDRLDDIDDLIDRALLKTQFFPKPLVAAIVGTCTAGGLELVLASDIRIAATDAQLGFPEVCHGIMPSGGGSMKLADQIGHARAMDLLLTGRLISGGEAERIGLVTEACAAEAVLPTALAKARAILANSHVAIRATKAAAALGRLDRYRALEAGERELAAGVRRSGHPEEGKAAFLTKRLPAFSEAM